MMMQSSTLPSCRGKLRANLPSLRSRLQPVALPCINNMVGWSRRAPAAALGPSKALHIRPLNNQPLQVVRSSANYGQLMYTTNQNSNGGKNDPLRKMVKSCIIEAVDTVFPGGHATVQSQGSTEKGTAIMRSDWDFFIKMDHCLPDATKQQRVDLRDRVMQYLQEQGIRYDIRLGERVIRLTQGHIYRTGQDLRDVDIVLERFKGMTSLQPINRPLADSHVSMQVVKYIKEMTSRYTHVPPDFARSQAVEEFVRLARNEINCQTGYGKLLGADGFKILLQACLLKIGRHEDLTRKQLACLQKAGISADPGWISAATREYNRSI